MSVTVTANEDGTYTLEAEQWLPQPPGDVFPFFADARNLEVITPQQLKFEVLTPEPIEMREGALIDYKLKVRGLPMRWRTLISVWDPPHAFQDEQLKGPYKLWRHRHTFEPKDGGTLAKDRVDYRVPGGPLSGVINKLVVQRDVESIFEHRGKVLREKFGSGAEQGERG